MVAAWISGWPVDWITILVNIKLTLLNKGKKKKQKLNCNNTHNQFPHSNTRYCLSYYYWINTLTHNGNVNQTRFELFCGLSRELQAVFDCNASSMFCSDTFLVKTVTKNGIVAIRQICIIHL